MANQSLRGNQPISNIPNKVGFVCRVNSLGQSKGRTHIWDGSDTVCRMWSTGGLKQVKYEFLVSAPTPICKNCLNHENYCGHEQSSTNEQQLLFQEQ